MADTQEQPRWKLSDLMGRLSAALPTKHADEPAPAPVMLSVREEHEDERDVAAAVPRTLRVAAAFSWRTLVVAGLVMAVLWGIARLTIVIMPVAIALTVAVLLEPLVSWMRRRLHFHSSLAATVGLLVFCLFFFLKEGRSIWLWCVRLLPAPARVPVHESAIRGWATFGSYVRTQIQVAAIDAIGIALGAFFLGVPLAIPIGVITFFAAFVPILGALTSGVIAVLVAAVNGGLTKAIIMLVIILVVQQIESNILQPFMMSFAVSLHPVAVMLVITAGSAIAGIAGAIFSVPIAAFINATVMYLHGHDPMPELATAQDRPGGPPGILEEKIAASYAGKPDTRPYVARVESNEEEVVASVDLHVEARVESEVDDATREEAPAGEKQNPGEPPTPHVEA